MRPFQLSTTYYPICLALLTLLLSITTVAAEEQDSLANSALDNYILYFDEWRFDWDHSNDFDNDYHSDWADMIDPTATNSNMYGCTQNLQTINKKLCVLQTHDGDYLFKFKDTNAVDADSFNTHSHMVSAAKTLSDYYDNILLKFDNDDYWSSVQSIDGVNGYEAIKKCQPFTFMELCAIYNPYADNLNIHAKVANFRQKKPLAKAKRTSAAYTDYDNAYSDDDTLSIDDALTFAMQDYDDTLGYWYWKGNTLGFDQFDTHSSDDTLSNMDKSGYETYGGHTYYFNELLFDWDDSRDWVSFSKATTEEVGGHPDKLEEVGAHPKQQTVKKGSVKDKGGAVSREYTKCTGAIPFINKHACVTVGKHDTRVQLTSAGEEEINILYNGLADLWDEEDMAMDGEEEDMDESSAFAADYNEMDSEYDEYSEYESEGYEYGSERRLLSTDSFDENMVFRFNNDADWDEIISSYGFDNVNEDNFGRFGSQRVSDEERDSDASHAITDMMGGINMRGLRPKLMFKSLPMLFPAIKKCVHTKIAKLCMVFDVHKKAVKLNIHLPRVKPFFRCMKHPQRCGGKANMRRLRMGKGVFNGVKRGMGLIRQIGRRNRYNKKRKHLKKALKQVRKIRKHLKHLARQLRKSMKAFGAHDIDENRYDSEEDTMAQRAYDMNDERGLLLYANVGTNDFNDIWDDDNEWNAIEDMSTWDGQQIRRKCLSIWKKRLCLCQFLGWLDGPEKYHCLFPHKAQTVEYVETAPYVTDTNDYRNIQVKNVNPKVITHQFHHIYGAETEIENELNEESSDSFPSEKPNWMPLWMWQNVQNQHQNMQISQMLYSAHEQDNADSDYDNEYDYDSDAYDEEEIVNLNDAYAYDYDYAYDDADMESEAETIDQRDDAWIEMSESATHSFDNEWDNDQHWDEVNELKTWEGSNINRKCKHLGKHRLCLCQFMGWMDTRKYQCVYHKRSWMPAPNEVFAAKKSPNAVFHDAGHSGGAVIHHFVAPQIQQTARYATVHMIPRRRKVIIHHFSPQAIHWQIHNPSIIHHLGSPLGAPSVIHHFHGGSPFGGAVTHHFHRVSDQSRAQTKRERETEGYLSYKLRDKRGKGRGGLMSREKALQIREKKERAREQKFKKLLWKDRHAHKMWKIMKTNKPVYGQTVTGKHIVAQQVNPNGNPIMVSMHKHMPNNRPQWMPQGLFTNLKHRGYYMVHHHQSGDHSTVTRDEQRYGHGSDFTHLGSAKVGDYDVYDSYYYADDDEMDSDYDDMYYYMDYDTTDSESDAFESVFEQFNDEKYEFDEDGLVNSAIDTFMDGMSDEWIISDIVNELETAFHKLFGSDTDESEYWDNLEELQSAKGEFVTKKCANVYDKRMCLCRYNGKDYHCQRKQKRRHKYYLDTRMPRDSPQWMSAHDFEWLKDQRLSAFTELLPESLMQQMSVNQLFNIPFNALSQLVSPAVKMEHITWHKDMGQSHGNGVASAKRMDGNYYDYYESEWYGSDAQSGYMNAFGDYIIDEFYNEMDGTQWVVTNEWTTDLNDEWHNNNGGIQTFSAATTQTNTATKTNTGTATKTNTGTTATKTNTATNAQTEAAKHKNAEQTLSGKCMLVFGRNVCMCEFINWVYDHSGTNPLYRCYSNGPQPTFNVQTQTQTQTPPQTPPQTQDNTKVLSELSTLQKEVASYRAKIDSLVAKNAGTTSGMSNSGSTGSTGAASTSHQGWGSKVAEYDEYEYEEYEQYVNDDYESEDYGYDNAYESAENEYYNDYESADYENEYESAEYGYENAYESAENEYESEDYGYENAAYESAEYENEYESADYGNNNGYESDNGYDNEESDYGYDAYYGNNNENENGYESEEEMDEETSPDLIAPNWWTEGIGFTQTVYIGVNTFWGLVLLSLFFGMFACSVVCAFLNFKRLFCKNGRLSFGEDYSYQKYSVNNSMKGLHTIEENKNVHFDVDSNNDSDNTDSGQDEYQS